MKAAVYTSDLSIIFQLFLNSDHKYIIYDPEGKLVINSENDFLVYKTIKELDRQLVLKGFKFALVTLKPKSFIEERFSQWSNLEYIFDFTNTLPPSNRLFNKYCYINNPDGTIRWIYPKETNYPSFLTLYNASSIKAKMIKMGIKWAFKLNRQGIFQSGGFTLFYRKPFSLQKTLETIEMDGYSIFTGTVGKNRKCIIEINKNSQTTHFVKVPLQSNSQNLVNHEKEQLNLLGDKFFKNSVLPKVSEVENQRIAVLSNVKPNKNAQTLMELQSVHLKALKEWYDRTVESKEIDQLDSYLEMTANVRWLVAHPEPANDLSPEKVTKLINRLQELFQNLNPTHHIKVAITHTDFTPWNMYVWQDKLYIYDWELSRSDMPLLFDAFHFIFQSGILIKRLSYEKMKKQLKKLEENPTTSQILQTHHISFEKAYQYYLLFNVSYYLKLYIQQEQLHVQAHWLIDTWLDALMDI